MRRLLATAALLAAACSANVDYDGTTYLCPDGRCPPGYACELGTCVRGGDDLPDAGDDEPDATGGGPDGGGGGQGGPLVSVPAGTFSMGCNVALDPGCPIDTLQHSVMLSAFQIEQHEVTHAEYQVCVAAGQCGAPPGFDPVGLATYPVASVSWDDAVDYCAFVGRHLPTEAQWERAARGVDERDFPWGFDAPDCLYANFGPCGGATAPVGSFPDGTSPVGAVDMAGNVAEWVGDYYSQTYYLTSPNVNPPGPASGSERVVRGGGFLSGEEELLTFIRASGAPGVRSPDLGFRCAR